MSHRGKDEFIIDLGINCKSGQLILPSRFANTIKERIFLRLPPRACDMILLRPTSSGKMHGDMEKDAIARIGKSIDAEDVRKSTFLVLSKVLPSLLDGSISEISDSLHEFQNLRWKKQVKSLLSEKWKYIHNLIEITTDYHFLVSSWGPAGAIFCKSGEGSKIASLIQEVLRTDGDVVSISWGESR